MENHVLNIDGNNALMWQAERKQPSCDIMNILSESPIANEADTGPRNANRGRRRLALGLKENGVDNIHFQTAVALAEAISASRARSNFPCAPRGNASTTINLTGTQDGGSLVAQC